MNDTPPSDPRLTALFAELGIPADYGISPERRRHAEATELVSAGLNMLGRAQHLAPVALAHWLGLAAAAESDGITLLLVSGYRSIDYQADLIRRKLENGDDIETILRVVAAPGFSEHHTGRAIDIASPGSRPLTEEFEQSSAFEWLCENAKKFDFTMSYPRGNAEGFIYEPWHWCCRAIEVVREPERRAQAS